MSVGFINKKLKTNTKTFKVKKHCCNIVKVVGNGFNDVLIFLA